MARKVDHYRALMEDLARNGGRTTYPRLLAHYDEDYHYQGFCAAVYRARRRGVVKKSKRGTIIEAVGVCPCCGRRFSQ